MKKDLRKRLRAILKGIPDGERRSRSDAAVRRLIELPEYQSAGTIMAFLSLPTEIDTTAAIHHAWRHHKRVLVPKVDCVARCIVPIEIRSLDEGLVVSSMGIREPVADTPVYAGDIDLMIVPGLGFDRQGHRIGRGGGFYDRFLARPELHAAACAMAYDEQLVEHIPVEFQDRPVNLLVTDRAVYRFTPAAPP